MANIGDRQKGFILKSMDELKDLRSRGELWIHEKTGAQVYKVWNSDPENLFCFGFRTPPEDSSGVAHIVEHAVLAGSRNYPTKDPFLYLLKSSLQTFLNAMTYPDKTLYPASSMVEKDYFNLMEVYGDAVFFPLLKQEIFSQEGHRLEIDEEGKLSYSGVVFNEMKGNYSSAESVMGEASLQSLCTEGPYSQDSGGNPLNIPDLSYQDFKKFHSTYYHPSNCHILLYGNFDLEPQLELLDRRFLAPFEPIPASALPQPQKRWSETREVKVPFPAEEGEEGVTLALNWLTAGPQNQQDYFLLDLLSDLLLGDGGVLSKALLDSGLGEDLSPLSGYETEVLEGNFTIGLRGATEGKLKEFRELVLAELKKYAREGLPADLVESTITAYEFSMKEVKGAGRGLRVLKRLYRSWNYDLIPSKALEFTAHLDSLRSRLSAGEPVFQNLIRQYLVENTHRADMVFIPDSEYSQGLESKLRMRLEKESKVLTPETKALLQAQSRALAQFQSEPDSPEAQKTLPQLGRTDLPRKVEVLESEFRKGSFPLFVHQGDTNDIGYVDLAFDASCLSEEDYFYAGLLTRTADGMGLEGLDYDLLARRIQLTTGGISFRFSSDQHFTSGELLETFWVRMKFLSRQTQASFDLLKDIFFRLDWNNLSRLKDLVLELRNQYQSAVMPQGHHFASLRAASAFHLPSWLSDRMGGLGQLEFLQSLGADLDRPGALEELRDRLRSLWTKILVRGRLRANITGEAPQLRTLTAQMEDLYQSLPDLRPYGLVKALPPMEDSSLIYLAPVTVGHNAWAFPSTGDRTQHPRELFLAHLWRTTTLWESIRMKGGAYGALASAHPSEGYFSFGSYRDPQVSQTFQRFLEALEEGSENPLGKSDLDLALVGVVGQELSPLSPSEEGYLYFSRWLKGITDQHRQERRDGYFSLMAKDLQLTAQKLRAHSGEGFRTVITSPDIWEGNKAKWDGRPVVVKKLNP